MQAFKHFAIAALGFFSMLDVSAQGLRHAFGNDESARFAANLGLAVASTPEYIGARHLRTAAVPEFNLSYRSQDLGSFALGTAAGGLVWLPVQSPSVNAGFLLSHDGGRRDSGGANAYRAGGARLRGLGDIRGSLLYGGFVSVDLGALALTAYVLKAPRGKGSGGAQGTLSMELPLADVAGFELSLSASANLADRRYMQAYFGVDALQAQRSGLARHDAAGGLKSAGLSIEASYALSRTWNLHGVAGAERLLRSAASSPVTERRMQPHAALGLGYSF